MTVHASARLDGEVENTIMARELAVRYELATGPGATVADKLQALALLGWRVLVDRRWVGSKRTTIDAVLVGPGGVIVADVRDWHDVQVIDGSIFCGPDCHDDETALLRSVTDRVQQSLRDHGVTRQALRSVWVFAGKRVDAYAHQVHLVGEANLASWVASLTTRLEHTEIDAIAAVLERDFVPYDAAHPLAARVSANGAGPGGDRGFASAPGLDIEVLATTLAVTAMATPVERWMTFLDPVQLDLVTTSWDGPARITGAAGSGKTVVGLHRAAYLAERQDDHVLFVVPTAALGAVVGSLADRLSPHAAGNLAISTLRDLAVGIVEQTGARLHLEPRQTSIAFMSAWMSVGRGGPLSQVDERASYWQEEIDHVIKGRGITELDDYLDSPRTGRAVLDQPQLEAAWRLYVDYQRRLAKTQQQDVNDVLVAARDLVREGLVAVGYSAVVVDAAEDVPLVGLQLLHAIAGDGPDRLLLLDDARQHVQPGGCTMDEAGIAVAEPVAILRTNRRNSADLLGAADEVVAGDTYADVDGTVRPHAPGVALRRRGPAADVMETASRPALDAALLGRLVEVADRPGVGWGDVAMLVHTSADVDHLRSVLMRAAIPVVDLDDYDGSSDRVVLGTFDRAKGLEFDHVLMPGLTREPAAQPGEHGDAHRERTQRMRREQYVGMTRARHGLWLGYLDPA